MERLRFDFFDAEQESLREIVGILHAVGIGLFSVIVWFVANLIAGETLDAAEWSVAPASAAGAVLFQIAAAAIGARIATQRN